MTNIDYQIAIKDIEIPDGAERLIAAYYKGALDKLNKGERSDIIVHLFSEEIRARIAKKKAEELGLSEEELNEILDYSRKVINLIKGAKRYYEMKSEVPDSQEEALSPNYPTP